MGLFNIQLSTIIFIVNHSSECLRGCIFSDLFWKWLIISVECVVKCCLKTKIMGITHYIVLNTYLHMATHVPSYIPLDCVLHNMLCSMHFTNYTYIYHTAQLISYDCLVSLNVNKYFDPIIIFLIVFKYMTRLMKHIPRLMKN